MLTEIREPIKVGAVFEPEGTIIPKWFVRNGRKYVVQKVTFTWKVRDGQKALYHFAVTDGVNLYELTYDAVTSAWKLMAVSPL
ncbi:MAG: hypothetical protein HY204_07535 [Nitrospirae bacterium]|nr:hypothetical protein [Nitrospirota bacterium]